MSEDAAAWTALVESLAPHMSPDWTKNAREHGNQPWIRLVLVVDAHDFLCRPGATEKIAMTMADLSNGRDDGQSQGWKAIADHTRPGPSTAAPRPARPAWPAWRPARRPREWADPQLKGAHAVLRWADADGGARGALVVEVRGEQLVLVCEAP